MAAGTAGRQVDLAAVRLAAVGKVQAEVAAG